MKNMKLLSTITILILLFLIILCNKKKALNKETFQAPYPIKEKKTDFDTIRKVIKKGARCGNSERRSRD